MEFSRPREEASQICCNNYCLSHLFTIPEHQSKRISSSQRTSAASRRNFSVATSSSIFPNSQFTNHESLPSLQQSFTEFTKAYPQYYQTEQIDQIRDQEYYNLSLNNHTCLDYIGIGLFSHSQLQKHDFTNFGISYKTGSLKTELLHGGEGSELESAIKRKIMEFLKVSETDYSMVFTANKTSAYKLLAGTYPFKSSRKLLTVYDYESEAVDSMITMSEKRGARVMSAEFSWPRLRIQSANLKKIIVRKKKKKRKRGLFVFPLHSRITGTRYPYLWMNIAKENGWHVLLDACALGPKDMDSFGLSLIQPDFFVCSFYKAIGENPTGFGCLFVKKSTISVLDDSIGSGLVSIVPEKSFWLQDESFGTDFFSGPIKSMTGETSEVKLEEPIELIKNRNLRTGNDDGKLEIEIRGLDQVASLGLLLISNRQRYLVNWLVISLVKLHHPNTKGNTLIRIYGPKVKFDRGPALAFNVFDWKGEKVEPILVQKLADRSNISLSYGFLNHIWFSDKYKEEKGTILEKRASTENGNDKNKRKDKAEQGIRVVTAALGFLANFEDVYRLWAFIAQFLDADFVEKERWRYTALNQKTIEI